MSNSSDSVCILPGVGAKTAQHLARLGVHTVLDAALHLPHRYEDRTRRVPIAELRPGQRALVQGSIASARVLHGRRRMSLVLVLADDSGSLHLRFFNFSKGQQRLMAQGARMRCYGELRRGADGPQMVHPDCDVNPGPLVARCTPVYPATAGLGQRMLRKICRAALQYLADARADWLVAGDGPGLVETLGWLHEPPPDCDIQALQERRHAHFSRLALEELCAHQVGMLRLRRYRARVPARALTDERLERRLRAALPFDLTAAQKRAAKEVGDDLARGHPMRRLLQGDVGSGKTAVAALAVARAAGSGVQSALMAPTELLAEQHLATLMPWLEPLGLSPMLLTGRMGRGARQRALDAIAGGCAKVITGTQALIQDAVRFHNLGLAIIDEQHRFGVRQRLGLMGKGSGRMVPHQLIMSATPIPRTLAMSYYSDMECSIIDQLPPGRTPVCTLCLSMERRTQVMERVRAACAGGRQAYWVCPLIEESESMDVQAATAAAEDLQNAMPGLRIALVHGRMKAAEAQLAIQRFRDGDTDLLVATTVIEVGVDVPNASIMVIENAERLGLAQLHQLRGRVGRGGRESHCLLLYDPQLSDGGQARLETLRGTNDGFAIADADLRLRGAGELLGVRQTGGLAFRVAELGRDHPLLARARKLAENLLAADPARARALLARWLPQSERDSRA